ncbi:hypothetical protein K8R33_02125 [archaeon]|nr:hypothetical protein [archaeon]
MYILKNHKGQATPGLLIGVGIILFTFLLIAIFATNQQRELYDMEDYIEKRSECLKIANLINSVYIAGPGTEVRTTTNFLITTFNSSLISVEGLEELEEYGDIPRIAFLASGMGPTTIEFYNQVNAELDPDPAWYKTCFTDVSGGTDCGVEGTAWINPTIENDIHNLMEHLDNYNTIYLEDPTMNSDHYADEYIQLLGEWVSQGNALILSEHVFCSKSWLPGNFSNTSRWCNADNTHEMFDVTLYQAGTWVTGYPSQPNVVVDVTDEAFSLAEGDQLSFEEAPYLANINATGFTQIAHHTNIGPPSNNGIAIAYWEYGDGKNFYFADFLVNYTSDPEKEFSEVLIDLISTAYYLVAHPEQGGDVTCYFSAVTGYKQLYGDILIKNENGLVILENVEHPEI